GIITALPLCAGAQINTPPEFQENGKFQRGQAAGGVDGTSHVSPQRAEVNHELVDRLRALPDFAAGARLIEQGMLGPAEEHFRDRGLKLGVAVTLFLSGNIDASAELLCTLATEPGASPALLPI
ncbi:MAG: hypothetical protein WKF37_11695, partial [Bryobacteraceae bacterium]